MSPAEKQFLMVISEVVEALLERRYLSLESRLSNPNFAFCYEDTKASLEETGDNIRKFKELRNKANSEGQWSMNRLYLNPDELL